MAQAITEGMQPSDYINPFGILLKRVRLMEYIVLILILILLLLEAIKK